MKRQLVVAVAAAVIVLLACMAPELSEGVSCSALQLAPCSSAIFSGANPTSECCARLNEQKPCLCGYIRNPNLGQYVNSPNARKVASICRVPYPKSC